MMIDKKDCLLWIGPKNEAGYGVIRIRGKQVRAHRFIYENVKGALPKSLVIDHLCMNRSCVNINHLEPVTITENFDRAKVAYQFAERCENGHIFTAENTKLIKNVSTCIKCSRNRTKKWQDDHKEQRAAYSSKRWREMTEEDKRKIYNQGKLRRKGAVKKKRRPLKTHCVYGHSLADAFVKKGKTNSRDCRECSRIRAEKYRARHAFPFTT